MDIPRTQQYSLEVQHSIGHNWLLSVAYVGSRTARLNVNQNINYIPLADLPYTPNFTTNKTAPGGGGSATQTYLAAQVSNPFYGNVPAQYSKLTTGTFLNNQTVSRQQLLVPYPQYGVNGVTELWRPIGKSHFNSMQVEVNKRLSYGLEFSSSFTWGRTLQSLGYFNPQDPALMQTMSPFDAPRQAKVNFVYFAPFGPGKKFLSGASPLVSRIVSGWSLSATPMLMDGFPAPTPANLMPTGASQKTANPTLSHWFNTCYTDLNGVQQYCSGRGGAYVDSTPAWRQTVAGQLYEWSPYMSGIRYVGHHRLDASIKKDTKIKERWLIVYRADFINAFNSSEWNQNLNTSFNSNVFGFVGPPASTPSSDSRVIMMSLQIKF